MGYYEELLDLHIELHGEEFSLSRYMIFVPFLYETLHSKKPLLNIFPHWDTEMSFLDYQDFKKAYHVDALAAALYRGYLVRFEADNLAVSFVLIPKILKVRLDEYEAKKNHMRFTKEGKWAK